MPVIITAITSTFKAIMSPLLRISADVIVHAMLPNMHVKSIVALASTSRWFRSLLSQQRVWALLDARDHVFIPVGQQLSCIRDQLRIIQALAYDVKHAPAPEARTAAVESLARLTALQSLLGETHQVAPLVAAGT